MLSKNDFQPKKKKKTHRPPHYLAVVHNLTQNARFHVLLLLNSNIFSYLIMESYTQRHNRRQKNRTEVFLDVQFTVIKVY